jgi:hypothetical protein
MGAFSVAVILWFPAIYTIEGGTLSAKSFVSVLVFFGHKN